MLVSHESVTVSKTIYADPPIALKVFAWLFEFFLSNKILILTFTPGIYPFVLISKREILLTVSGLGHQDGDL